MYLAYLDDSGTKDKNRSFQVLSAVVIKDDLFSNIEILAAASVEMWIPQDKQDQFLEKFEEFHASELFGGYGPFEGIDQTIRFEMIHALLNLIQSQKLTVIYGAVNKKLLANQMWASASPIDICFRICAEAIEQWLTTDGKEEFALLIADDFEKQQKAELKKSFRQLRKPIRPPQWTLPKLEHVHDAMYFGDSKDSIGIQLADLCSYFILKHLEGGDRAAEGFYNILAPQIVYSKLERT